MMKSVKYRVSVVEFTSQKEHVKGIPAVASYSNFSFEEGGIRVWKTLRPHFAIIYIMVVNKIKVHA